MISFQCVCKKILHIDPVQKLCWRILSLPCMKVASVALPRVHHCQLLHLPSCSRIVHRHQTYLYCIALLHIHFWIQFLLPLRLLSHPQLLLLPPQFHLLFFHCLSVSLLWRVTCRDKMMQIVWHCSWIISHEDQDEQHEDTDFDPSAVNVKQSVIMRPVGSRVQHDDQKEEVEDEHTTTVVIGNPSTHVSSALSPPTLATDDLTMTVRIAPSSSSTSSSPSEPSVLDKVQFWMTWNEWVDRCWLIFLISNTNSLVFVICSFLAESRSWKQNGRKEREGAEVLLWGFVFLIFPISLPLTLFLPFERQENTFLRFVKATSKRGREREKERAR